MNAGEFTSGLIRHVRHLERQRSGDDALGTEARVIWNPSRRKALNTSWASNRQRGCLLAPVPRF
jgi:hypothetical protein